MKIEEEYMDVLQNIEFAVASHYRQNLTMTDYSVLRVYEALIRQYTAEITGRQPMPAALDESEEVLLNDVQSTCEWRLGRIPDESDQDEESRVTPIDVPTLILCLKRLVKSVNKWTKVSGRQGYLKFMSQYVR